MDRLKTVPSTTRYNNIYHFLLPSLIVLSSLAVSCFLTGRAISPDQKKLIPPRLKKKANSLLIRHERQVIEVN